MKKKATKRRGRPPKMDKDKRSVRVNVDMTPAVSRKLDKLRGKRSRNDVIEELVCANDQVLTPSELK